MESKTEIRPRIGAIASFLRKRDYTIHKVLGQGACGQTVLLHDDQVDDLFVCKKYAPITEGRRAELFQGFLREVKLLYRLHHPNVVRVFNWYLYPDSCSGYILMEYVRGSTIDEYVRRFPERLDDCFMQAVDGFAYLESCGVLHRDIRMQNLMVDDNGVLKIIDLGFGKEVKASTDFQKSIDLNWHCSVPAEFSDSRYDFCTEVYFVGRLFERLAADNAITDFKHAPLVSRMCAYRPNTRPQSFAVINTELKSGAFAEIKFRDDDLMDYRNFASAVFAYIAEVERAAKYVTDPDRVLKSLADVLKVVGLEEEVPDGRTVVSCLLDGSYRFRPKCRMGVQALRDFVGLLSRSPSNHRRVILANLHAKLDVLDRFDGAFDDDIPF